MRVAVLTAVLLSASTETAATTEAPPTVLNRLAAEAGSAAEDDQRLTLQDQMAALPMSTVDLQICLKTCEASLARAWSAHALGHLPSTKHQRLLLDALKSQDSAVRREAMEGLANIGDRSAIPHLVQAASRESVEALQTLAQQTAEAIIARDRETPPDHRSGLQSEDPLERVAAIEALQTEANWEHRPLFISALEDTHPAVKKAAVLALGSLGDARALNTLHPLLDEYSGPLLHAVIGSIATLKNRTSIDHLLPLLDSEDPVVRVYATRALGWIPSPQSLQALKGVAGDTEEEVRTELILTLGKLTDLEVGPILVDLLGDDSLFLRAEAARLLGETRYADSSDPLAAALADDDPLVRINAASSLAALGILTAESALREALESSESEEEAVFHSRALETLGFSP